MRCPKSAVWALVAATVLAAPGHAQSDDECPNPSGWQPRARLQTILEKHKEWFEMGGPAMPRIPGKANLCNANLSGANLREANLNGANLSSATLAKADLFEADLINADLRKANLFSADLRGAKLIEADLREAELWKADLSRAELWGAKLGNARYEPITVPRPEFLGTASGLSELRWKESPHGLNLLREAFRTSGMRQQEREVTYAIEHWRTQHALDSWRKEKDFGSALEGALRLVFFEWTTGYGLHYDRPVKILFALIGIMVVFYIPVVAMPGPARKRSGIFRIWPKGRIEETGERFEARDDEKVERLNAKGLPVVGYALYFSLLAAFQIGWRELNVGSWLTRLQSREYALRAKGWVRVVSGAQSLVSVYLLAMWALTNFGIPFQ